MSDDDDPIRMMRALIRQNQNTLRFEGIAFTILGIVALFSPVFFALAFNVMIGLICLLAAGVIAGKVAKTRDLPTNSAAIMSLLLYLLLGLVLVAYPLGGVVTINLLLACFFLLDGIFKIVSSLQIRPLPRWGWIFFSGFLSFVLSILIVMAIPEGSAWVLGILLGINLLITGLALLSFLSVTNKP